MTKQEALRLVIIVAAVIALACLMLLVGHAITPECDSDCVRR